MVRRPRWPTESPYRHHVLVGNCCGLTGAAAGLITLLSARFLLGSARLAHSPWLLAGCSCGSKSGARAHPGITHCFKPVCGGGNAVCRCGYHECLRMARHFLHFRVAGRDLGRCIRCDLPESPEDHKGVIGLSWRTFVALTRMARSTARGRKAAECFLEIYSTLAEHVVYRCCLWLFLLWTYFFLTWYPTYLQEYRHFSLKSLGFVASLPLFAGMVGDLVGGSVSDLVYRRTGKLKLARRVVAVPGMVIFRRHADSHRVNSQCVDGGHLPGHFIFSFLELVIGPAWAVPMDVGGEFSGTVSSVMIPRGHWQRRCRPSSSAFSRRGDSGLRHSSLRRGAPQRRADLDLLDQP